MIASPAVSEIIGASARIRELRSLILKVAARDSNVLITGETGTGKERVADAIHAHSTRSKQDMVCINCAAVPEALFESELFGFERGAFTGALTRHEGRLQQADGGTVFLDEIGDMSLGNQAKILRAIEQKQIYRVGGRTAERLNIRVIAATNQNLAELVAKKQFRGDLYYRLSVINIELPPLRERREDVALLFEYYMRQLASTTDGRARKLTDDALSLLRQHGWPGNVRELRNLVELLLLDASTPTISPQDLPAQFRSCSPETLSSERERLIAVLSATHWNKSKAAQQLRCSRMTVYRKIAKYEIRQSRIGPELNIRDST
jgi:DNA-binding NtrC family response regulator